MARLLVALLLLFAALPLRAEAATAVVDTAPEQAYVALDVDPHAALTRVGGGLQLLVELGHRVAARVSDGGHSRLPRHPRAASPQQVQLELALLSWRAADAREFASPLRESPYRVYTPYFPQPPPEKA